jgi:hypothetical protein
MQLLETMLCGFSEHEWGSAGAREQR